MADPALNIVREERCVNLRWKGLFNDETFDPAIQGGDDRIFWCLKTQLNLGPDGKLVDSYECSAGRECYRPL